MRVDLFDWSVDIDLGELDIDGAGLRRQLGEYTAGQRRDFDVNVSFPATFTGRVMRTMATIPYGETRTYGQIATQLDTAPRAVGGACGRNPVPVVVPCHRVIRSDGGLGGYSAAGGIDLKRRLLDHESAHQ